jgi:hypothetical protein
MWMWMVAATIACAGCGETKVASDDVNETRREPRVLATPLRAQALGLMPGQPTRGWHMAVIADQAAWDAFVEKAGFGVGDFAVDFANEVALVTVHESIGGQLEYAGFELGRDGQGLFRYGPATTFGPAWQDAGGIALVAAVPRAGLKSVYFMNGKHMDVAIPL